MKRLSIFLHGAIIIVLVSLLQFCRHGNREINTSREINNVVKYLFENNLFNGSVLVAMNGKILYNKSLGYANIEDNRKLSKNTPSNIGSVTKQFTAMAILLLVEDGLLSLDDSIDKYFPEIPNSGMITIRQLLTHTSGLPRINTGRNGGIDMDKALAELCALKELGFDPGTKYSYSNAGYMLLARILELVTGITYPEFLRENFFTPLKMNNTFLRSEIIELNNIRAIGYNELRTIYDANDLTYGHGGIYSAVNDLYKWNQALYSGKLISDGLLAEAFSPGRLNDGSLSRKPEDSEWGYGFGWLLKKDESGNIVWHDGGVNGFSAIFYRELKKKLCIVILSNMGEMGTNAPTYTLFNPLLKILNNEPYELPKVPISLWMKKLIDEGGIELALREFSLIEWENQDRFELSENRMNRLGYYYLNMNEIDLALHVLLINTELFPDSSNCFDSLGEAYMLNGQDELARQSYQRSLELNPLNDNAKSVIETLDKKRAEIE